MDILQFLAIGLVIGVISGALGIGGGVLMLPALIWICKLPPSRAAGTTLAVLVVPVVLPAAWAYYQNKNVDFRAAAFIAVAFACGGFGGAWLHNANILPEEWLRLFFGLIMIYIALNMILMSDPETAKAAGGLSATIVAWLLYWRLRVLGKRALVTPKLEQQIRRMDEEGHTGTEYHI